MTNPVMIVELHFSDRDGLPTTAWVVYYKDQLFTVEYTVGHSALTNRRDFDTEFKAVA